MGEQQNKCNYCQLQDIIKRGDKDGYRIEQVVSKGGIAIHALRLGRDFPSVGNQIAWFNESPRECTCKGREYATSQECKNIR